MFLLLLNSMALLSIYYVWQACFPLAAVLKYLAQITLEAALLRDHLK